MRIAVTNHAVDRYIERVDGAKGFFRESVREQIRKLVEDGFAEGAVRPHPLEEKRRIIPFRSGKSVLYLSIGPNETTYIADIAVISVLFEHEMTEGKVGMSLSIGDLFSYIPTTPAVCSAPEYVLFIGRGDTIEYYRMNEVELKALVETRRPLVEEVSLYRLVR